MKKSLLITILTLILIPIIVTCLVGDLDKDRKLNIMDNCPQIPNYDQADADNDNIGDVCDNCKTIFNTTQIDIDKDGLGNQCDPCPNEAGNQNGCPPKQ